MPVMPLPSHVVQARLTPDGTDRQRIAIPRDELFRIRDIFRRHAYGVPGAWPIRERIHVVDVGANVGCFALYAQRWAREVRVYSFEPNPQVLPLLQRNTAHLPNVQCHAIGLSDRDGAATLYLHPRNTGQASMSGHRGAIQAIPVKVRHAGAMLTELGIEHIDILKVDTEGSEVPIFHALAHFLPNVDVVMYEYHRHADRQVLADLLTDFVIYQAPDHERGAVGLIKAVNRRVPWYRESLRAPSLTPEPLP